MWNWTDKLQAQLKTLDPFAIVTVVRCEGSTPREVGAKMIVLSDGKFFGTIGGGRLEDLAIQDAVSSISEGTTQRFSYPLGVSAGQCCGGRVDILVEIMNSGPQLYLFGAGHVGQAVSQVLAETPFHVHLIDSRKDWIGSPSIPSPVSRHSEGAHKFLSEARWHEERTYVVVMTHDHALDQEIVAYAAQKPGKYLGLIGSRTKWARFRKRLLSLGLSEPQLDRVRSPLGLPLGGKSPKEVAISLASELLSVYHGTHDRLSTHTPRRRAVKEDGATEGATSVRADHVDHPPASPLL